MNEKEAEKLELGKLAEALYPAFVPLLQKRKEYALNQMKHLYLSGDTQSALYIAQVAVISAMDGLMSEIESSIKKSRLKEKDILHDSYPRSNPN